MNWFFMVRNKKNKKILGKLKNNFKYLWHQMKKQVLNIISIIIVIVIISQG